MVKFFSGNKINSFNFQIDLSETEYLNNMIQIIRLMYLNELESIHLINYKNES